MACGLFDLGEVDPDQVLARGGPLLTKQFAGEQGRELALDWASLPAQLDVEQRLSRLSAWLLAAERVAVASPALATAPGIHAAAVERLAERAKLAARR